MTDKVQKKPVSEDLEQAAIDYCSGNKGSDARVRTGFIMGAKWQKEQMMAKAEEFIYSALNNGIMGTANIEDFMRLFKKYMEG